MSDRTRAIIQVAEQNSFNTPTASTSFSYASCCRLIIFAWACNLLSAFLAAIHYLVVN
jgi:hypothetical protein